MKISPKRQPILKNILSCSEDEPKEVPLVSQNLNSVKLLTVTQTAECLELSRAKIYTLIAREGLPTIKFGRAVRISPTSLCEWLKKREQEQQSQ